MRLLLCASNRVGLIEVDYAGSEIAELMAVKAKYSVGGEYAPDWNPHVRLAALSYSC